MTCTDRITVDVIFPNNKLLGTLRGMGIRKNIREIDYEKNIGFDFTGDAAGV